MKKICRKGAYWYAICEDCKTFQLTINNACPYCAAHIDYCEENRLANKPPILGPYNETMLLLWLNQHGLITSDTEYDDALQQISQLSLTPNGMVEYDAVKGLTLTERINIAKKRHICEPALEHGLWWDYPATVDSRDGIEHRQCYMDDQVVFKIESGPLGRLFVNSAGLTQWFARWRGELYWLLHPTPAWTVSTTHPPKEWYEVPLNNVFHRGESKIGHIPVVMAEIIAPDTTIQLPECVPLQGFTNGLLRRVPEAYRFTWETAVAQPARNAVSEMTWRKGLCRFDLSDGKMQQTARFEKERHAAQDARDNMYRYWGLSSGTAHYSFHLYRHARAFELENNLRKILAIANHIT